eukprot:scaffold4081_cov268-Pinguiococcus_pyrenoidosus.AAC.13
MGELRSLWHTRGITSDAPLNVDIVPVLTSLATTPPEESDDSAFAAGLRSAAEAASDRRALLPSEAPSFCLRSGRSARRYCTTSAGMSSLCRRSRGRSLLSSS